MRPLLLGILTLQVLLALSWNLRAAVFTNDSLINSTNLVYEGQSIVISNCTVTMDGPHSFASVRVAGSGTLTHSPATNGFTSIYASATNEHQTLTDTNPVALANQNVFVTSVVVRDLSGLTTFTNTADYELSGSNSFMLLARTLTSSIPSGATVQVSYDYAINTTNGGLMLTLAGDLEIEPGAKINADGRGSLNGLGKGGTGGSPAAGSGGGYGGYGGVSTAGIFAGAPYGSPFEPASLGSGGGTSYIGNGGAGGGLVRISLGGSAKINGTVTAAGADGTNSRSGGGSGGSIWLSAQYFTGAGTLTANGGGGEPIQGGGGGAGRIAIDYDFNSFAGTLVAHGGNGAQAGGAGSIYLHTNGTAGLVIFDNGGIAGAASAISFTNTADLVLQGRAYGLQSGQQTVGNLDVRSNSTMSTSTSNNATFTLVVLGDATLEAGGAILMDAYGFLPNAGSGLAPLITSSVAGGSGHGGYGGRGSGNASGGTAYGSIASPATLGSGGRSVNSGTSFPGGSGGGVVRLTVNGNLRLDGRISANATGGSGDGAGGGSGGSIWLLLGGLTGNGTVSANGGAGGLPNGGGGGGGRIAITYGSNTFTGSIISRGGAGFVAGGGGTIFTRANSDPNGNFFADNGGATGTNTLLDTGNFTVNLSGGASARMLSSFNFYAVNIGSNASLISAASTSTINITSNLTIAKGGAFNADATVATGPGNGGTSIFGSGGAGHAGYGGRGAGANGGNAIGSSISPTTTGSAGGSPFFPSQAQGGGAMHLSVNGPAIIDGTLSSNGGNSPTNNGGGGSGGSVWLTCNSTLAGTGIISANGGSGFLPNGSGGGGGGGRVAITFSSSSFSGTVSSKGGGGYVSGGAGTIYRKQVNATIGDLIVDNSGIVPGTNTFLDPVSQVNVTVSGGASLKPFTSSIQLNSLTVASNSAFQFSQLTLTVMSNTTVLPGGRIYGDGQNSSNSQGAGQSSSTGSGGGAHGGYGGSGVGLDQTGRGGLAFDSASNPTLPGGYGGTFGQIAGASSGLGGGALHLNVLGLLNVQGSISANGFSTSTNSNGGGAGGSLWLTLGGLAGNGLITADGGSGNLPNGGGGGGGRIAIYYASNSFNGSASAKGGDGLNAGGAGTIYWKANTNTFAAVFADNGGLRGSNTLVVTTGSSIGSFDLTLQNGAISASIGTPRDLFVRTNATLKQSGTLFIARNVTIDPGGAINLNAMSASGVGAGVSSSSSPRGGGGYGGYGALNPLGPGYGIAYGSALSPTNNGSQGGNFGSGASPIGGYGGSAIHLIASNLTMNGSISANGGNGDFNSGGGSGGSLWLTVSNLAGIGQISATGGTGNGSAGGGGGGRIAITLNGNLAPAFTGIISAPGGGGASAGGAGTIYLKDNTQPLGTMLLNNSGLTGTNTPLSSTSGWADNLVVSSGAVLEAQDGAPTLNKVIITNNSAISCRSLILPLNLGVLGDVLVDSSSAVSTDAKGFGTSSGIAPGQSISGQGGGGGYGGAGGNAASGALGGTTNGSISQPTSLGSGGGAGSGPVPALSSQGGGALRLSVGGTLSVEGKLTANGNAGIQDDAGGGSGGSIWVTASKITGAGTIRSLGGDGDPFGGGGGGGGRIAIYSATNAFSGLINVAGGVGAVAGQTGTVYTSSIPATLNGIGSSPTNTLINTVTYLNVVFSDAVNPNSVTAADLKLFTPTGLLSQTNIAVSFTGANTVQFGFPPLNNVGNYRAEVGPGITDVFGNPMSQVYTGYFSIALPTISGFVTNANGQPVAGVILQPSGLQPAITDGAGAYSIGIPSGWTGIVTPSSGTSMFIPGSRSYANLTNDITGENYTIVPTIAATIQLLHTSTNLLFNWQGYAGVTYTVYYSTNLNNWLPYSSPFPGTNGLMQFDVPLFTSQSNIFFRIGSQN